MALDFPDTGLSLRRDGEPAKPTQIMRLNLVQTTLDDLIQSLRTDQPARVRLGKHPTLHYGSHAQPFHSRPESLRSELYAARTADPANLYFAGVLSHSLEAQRAKADTAATDQALANLEQSLNAFERGKESKQTHMIASMDEVRALKGSKARRPTSKVELEKDRLLKNTASRSVSSSPGLGIARSPTFLPSAPTSIPVTQDRDRARLDALKVPFIHLLAVRPVSVKVLARQTRSSVDDCQKLAQKYGIENRDNREQYDLRDKAYRDLDIWKFPYPGEERDQAVKNAISAFDRMRISRSDNLWQMLLPKEERGKGKCLSRLDLRTGPKKPLTPRIQVDDVNGYSTGHDTDRNGVTPMETPRSTPQKKEKPKQMGKPNSTLTGRVTKKTERKPTKPEGKFKSAEFVHDSDEEEVEEEMKVEEGKSNGTNELANGVPNGMPNGTKHSNGARKPSTGGGTPANASEGSSQTSKSDSSPPKTTKPQPKPKPKPNGQAQPNPLKRKAADQPARPTPAPTPPAVDPKRRRAASPSSGSTSSSSPPLSHELLLRQLREKSAKFKQFYAKYRALHDSMAAHADPPRAEVERLQRQHGRLQRMKKEIWDEDRRLRERI